MVEPGTGEVRALAQSRPMGRDKKHGQTYLNYVVPTKYGDSGGFQAGSTFKVFVLASAIKQGIPLSTQINVAADHASSRATRSRTARASAQHRRLDGRATRPATGTFNLYTGTQESVNTFFAQLEQRTGLCEPITLAKEMGVELPDAATVGPVHPRCHLHQPADDGRGLRDLRRARRALRAAPGHPDPDSQRPGRSPTTRTSATRSSSATSPTRSTTSCAACSARRLRRQPSTRASLRPARPARSRTTGPSGSSATPPTSPTASMIAGANQHRPPDHRSTARSSAARHQPRLRLHATPARSGATR